MSDTIVSLSRFKADASRLLERLREDARPVILTQNGRASAVVQDYASYRRQQESLLLLKLMVQGEADVQHARLHEQSAVFEEARARIEDAERGGD